MRFCFTLRIDPFMFFYFLESTWMPPILRSCALLCSTVVKEFFSLLLFFLGLHELPLGATFITATATGIQSAWCKSFPILIVIRRLVSVQTFRMNFENRKPWKLMGNSVKFSTPKKWLIISVLIVWIMRECVWKEKNNCCPINYWMVNMRVWHTKIDKMFIFVSNINLNSFFPVSFLLLFLVKTNKCHKLWVMFKCLTKDVREKM